MSTNTRYRTQVSNTSITLTASVARVNASVLASLALAPSPPKVMWTTKTGKTKGSQYPMLTRGKSQYDAVLRWLPNDEADLAGYAVFTRSTTAADWEQQTYVGKVSQYSMPGVSIDDTIIGVRAIDTDRNWSMISAYQPPVKTTADAKTETK